MRVSWLAQPHLLSRTTSSSWSTANRRICELCRPYVSQKFASRSLVSAANTLGREQELSRNPNIEYQNTLIKSQTDHYGPRLPRSVQLAYLRPLRRSATHGLPVCDVQFRSYNIRSLDLMTDFAMRAAYYLNISASGPTYIPRVIERWTLTKSNFVHKKTQENFERITFRRLVQIQDAHLDAVQVWLAFLRKHAYHGVGMKANVWEHERIGTSEQMEVQLQSINDKIDSKWNYFGRRNVPFKAEEVLEAVRNS